MRLEMFFNTHHTDQKYEDSEFKYLKESDYLN